VEPGASVSLLHANGDGGGRWTPPSDFELVIRISSLSVFVGCLAVWLHDGFSFFLRRSQASQSVSMGQREVLFYKWFSSMFGSRLGSCPGGP